MPIRSRPLSKLFLIALFSFYAGSAGVFASEPAPAQVVIVSPNIAREASYTLRAYVNGHEVHEDLTLHEGSNRIVRSYESLLGAKTTMMHEVILDTVPPDIQALDYPSRTADDFVVVKGRVDGQPFTQKHPVPGAPDTYVITVRVSDRAGNATEQKIRVIKDKKKKAKLPLTDLLGGSAPPLQRADGLRVLTGDYALIIQITDSSGSESSQALRAKEGASPVVAIFKGVIKKVVYVYYRTVRQELPEMATRHAEEKMKASFAVFDVKNEMPVFEFKPGTLVATENSKAHARAESGSKALVSLEAGREEAASGLAASAIGTIETSVTPGKKASFASAKPEEKQAATKNTSTKMTMWQKEEREPEPDAQGKKETKELTYTQTHVQIPDEFGGMTITLDNYKTGEHTVIHKDQGGHETGRVVTKMANQEKVKKDDEKK